MAYKDDKEKLDSTRLVYSEAEGDFVEAVPVKKSLFLKGPIPLNWLRVAADLPGKALNVALAIRWHHDMAGGKPIKISKKAMDLFGFSADACRDALRRLEGAGLVEVTRLPGQKPLIKLVS